MPRLALGIEYDGSAFRGWQSQAHAIGIQSVVEAALSKVADHAVAVVAAGRTDACVHACMQVAHFDSMAIRTERGWTLGGNTHLPKHISLLWAREVPDDFHARYSAEARSYRYIILNRAARPALAFDRVCWVRDKLDERRMQSAASLLLGEHDFSSFRAAECQAHSPVRNLQEVRVERHADRVTLDVTANAFLHHMVRNIAGVLLAIGTGERPVEWAAEVLAARDRRCGGVTAAPQGLYLVGVKYPPEYRLPTAMVLPPIG